MSHSATPAENFCIAPLLIRFSKKFQLATAALEIRFVLKTFPYVNEKMKTMESPKIPFLELDLPILNKKKRGCAIIEYDGKNLVFSFVPKTCAW